MTLLNKSPTNSKQFITQIKQKRTVTYRGKDWKDDRLINGYGHPLRKNKFKNDETHNDNGIGEHDKLGEEDIEGKCFRVEFKKKQINKELTDKKRLRKLTGCKRNYTNGNRKKRNPSKLKGNEINITEKK